MNISDLQEQVAALYLRLNGYFVSGFIIHAPEGEVNKKGEPRRNRGEIDVLAVRFPHITMHLISYNLRFSLLGDCGRYTGKIN